MLATKKTALATGLLGATAAIGLTAGPATAEDVPYTLEQVCGGSYHFANELPLAVGGRQVGLTVLGYSAETKENCAVTFKTARIGTPSLTAVSLRRQGGGFRTDKGSFKFYAGPVYVKAPGACVQFGGLVKVKAGMAFGRTPFGNCG